MAGWINGALAVRCQSPLMRLYGCQMAVTSYDIRPGNTEGLLLFRHFINLSLTYLLRNLLTHLHTAPGPTWGTGCQMPVPLLSQLSTSKDYIQELSSS